MRNIFLSLSILFTINVFSHPLHMSVSNITITDSEVQMQVKIEAHDLAHELNALNHLDQKPIYYISNASQDSLLIKHFYQNFKFDYNQSDLSFKDIVIELIDGDFIFQASIKVESSCQSCKVRNTLLLQSFHDQKNLVIVNYRENEKGLELTVDKPEETVVF